MADEGAARAASAQFWHTVFVLSHCGFACGIIAILLYTAAVLVDWVTPLLMLGVALTVVLCVVSPLICELRRCLVVYTHLCVAWLRLVPPRRRRAVSV
jgi:hypothetical protein